MSKFLRSLGIAQSELRLLESVSSAAGGGEVADLLADTGEFEQGLWRLPSGEAVNFETVSWESQQPPPADLWGLPDLLTADIAGVAADSDDDSSDAGVSPLLARLPVDCLARVAASLSLGDLAAACAVSAAFRRLVRGDACWVERLRRGGIGASGHLRGCHQRLAGDPCCSNPFARLYFHVLLGLYRVRPLEPSGLEASLAAEQLQLHQQRLVPDSCLAGALFQRPVLSPVFLGRPLVMEFRIPGVHPGRYDVLLRVKKLLCDPLDSESVASAADSSGVRIPLLQARINRRNVTISNFECTIQVTADAANDELEAATVLSADTVSHLLQNYSMPSDRWFYWRLAPLELSAEDSVRDLRARVSVMRRGVADATVTQEEFERELRNALLIDHLFLRIQLGDQTTPVGQC